MKKEKIQKYEEEKEKEMSEIGRTKKASFVS